MIKPNVENTEAADGRAILQGNLMPNNHIRTSFSLFAAATLSLALAAAANAQAGGASAGSSASASGMAAGTAAKNSTTVGRDMSLTNPEVAMEVQLVSSKKELRDYDAFKNVALTDAANKIKAGEKFLSSYPNSNLVKYVYPVLVVCYIQSGQIDKGVSTAQKDFEVNKNDFRTMAVLSQTLARSYNPAAADANGQLANAEDYGKKALQGSEELKKPEGVSDETFTAWKKDTQAMAHGGMGLVALRRNQYPEAIAEIEKAISLNDGDQTNYYLLGVANLNSDHPGEAATAFRKCAAIQGNLQAECSKAAGGAKKTN